jgi:hypothetical protein
LQSNKTHQKQKYIRDNFFGAVESPRCQQFSHQAELGFVTFIHKKHLTMFLGYRGSHLSCHGFVCSSTCCAALREADLIPTLLPVFKDMDPEHTRLVSAAMQILEAFMDYSNSAGTWFRDLGGLNDTVARLKLEEAYAEEGSQLHRAEVQVTTKGKAPVLEEDMHCSSHQLGSNQAA